MTMTRRREGTLQEMNLYFTFKCRKCVNLLGVPISLKLAKPNVK